jgi:structural maintenance of chromosome 1
LQSDDEVHFSRTLTAQGTTAYQLNDRNCTWEQYNAKLLSYNVIVKAKNFLVFQVRVSVIREVCGREYSTRDHVALPVEARTNIARVRT